MMISQRKLKEKCKDIAYIINPCSYKRYIRKLRAFKYGAMMVH